MLYVKQPNGRYAPAPPDLITAQAAELIKPTLMDGPLSAPDAVRNYLTMKLATLEHEVFSMIALTNRNKVIDYIELFRGTIDGCSVHPREVVKTVLNLNAAAVIFAHNHPSGTPEPSQADEVITRRLKSALSTIDVRIHDHMVISTSGYVSFAERGLL